jgi:hypothetical protein
MLMADYKDIKGFVNELESYAKQKLNYPDEIQELLKIIEKSGTIKEFEDLILQAKFLVKTQEIIKRIGPGTDGFEKISSEFQSGVKKAKDLLDLIMNSAPSDFTRELKSSFNLEETDNFNRLLKLFYDLSWIKNWQIDGKLLPFDTQSEEKPNYKNGEKENETELLTRIQKSALSIAALLIMYLFIDYPITVIGRILLVGIAAFLTYIIIQIHEIKRNK